MAYAVLISLKQTISGLVNNDSYHIIENSSTQILGLVYEELDSLQQVLEKLNKSCSISNSSSRSRGINRERINGLDGQIRVALSQFEDILDFHFSDQIHSQIQPQMIRPLLFTLDFEQLSQQFISLKQTLIKMKAEYITELCEEEEEEEEEEVKNVFPSMKDHHFGGDDDDDESDSDDMVGLSNTFTLLKDRITEDDTRSPSEWKIISISGMAGIGKTALAKKLFRDPEIATLFELRAFVNIGQNYRLEVVLLDILRQVNPEKSLMESTASLKRMVYQSLKNRSCFIVLDDLWHKTIWNELEPVFPDNLNNDCQVLMSSRLLKVAYELASPSATYRVPFLNKTESWHLLREKVFGDEESSCPPQLVKAGKKIAENCDGLPLTILKVANILSRADKTPEFWNEVAGNKQHPVFIDAYEQMFEVLYPSYEYLPQHLKPFFLYIGVFPQNYEIPSYELINLWCGEGLYGTNPYAVMMYLIKLYNRNLVMRLQQSYYNPTKKIGLHSVFWYMCNKEARKNKFFYSLNIGGDSLSEDMRSQRRLCIQNNVLFGIKDVSNSISSISTVRSLLCTGAIINIQYQYVWA